MTKPFDIERGLLATYATRVLADQSLPLPAAIAILLWFKDRMDLFDFAPPQRLAKALSKVRKKGRLTPKLERAFLDARPEYLEQIRKLSSTVPEMFDIKRNIGLVLQAFDLPDEAQELLLLCAAHERWHSIDSFCYQLKSSVSGLSYPLALMTGLPRPAIERLISPSGALVQNGLMELVPSNDDLVGQYGRLRHSLRVDAHLDERHKDLAAFREALLGQSVRSHLSSEDFDHVAPKRDLVRRLLGGWVRHPQLGINILLYGPPGSGKTELAKIAAATAGLELYAAGETVGGQREPSRKSRLADLNFTERLLQTSRGAAILFDELEDVGADLLDRGGSKLYLNRLLECAPVPVIWTSNNIGDIDPAIIRRMTLAIELKSPPPDQRARIWRHVSERIDVKLSDADCETLGRSLGGEPSVIHNAATAAKLAGGGSKTAKRAASDLLWALGASTPQRDGSKVPFDPALAPASSDLEVLTKQIVQAPSRRISLCLSGPPGTGKTAYAQHLADRLGLELMKKRASDLLDMWVGSTEQKIAEAFKQAADDGAFLFFDEADSLLTDRRHAFRSWEVSQVNEMLTWMEDHPLPFCCATNLVDRLDPASMRRFVFHVKFRYLDAAGVAHAWRHFFNSKAPSEVKRLSNLTPGDFAQARRRAEALGQLDDGQALSEIMSELSAAKPDATQQIGFVRSV